MSTPEVATIADWHEAVNDGDVDRLVALSREDIEVGGPRGSGSGVHLLRDWISRAGIHLEPRRVFHRGGTAVVEQTARWRSPEDGQMTERQDVASVFLVRDGRVASVVRHSDLASARTAAGLEASDEQRRGE